MAYKRGNKWFGFYRDAAGDQHTKQFTGARRRHLGAGVEGGGEKRHLGRPRTVEDDGGEWSEPWMVGRVHPKPKTLSSYRSLLSTRVLPRWGTVPLTKVRHSDVVAWAASMRAELSASRTRQAHHLLTAMLDDAVKSPPAGP